MPEWQRFPRWPELDLNLVWNPEFHPRWPGHAGAGKGGEFMEVAGVLDRIDKSVSKSQNLAFLLRDAKGKPVAQSIRGIVGTRDGGNLKLAVSLNDGRTGSITVAPTVPFEQIMERLKRIDDIRGAQAQRTFQNEGGGETKRPTPRTISRAPVEPLADLKQPSMIVPHLSDAMLGLVQAARHDERANRWPPPTDDQAIAVLGDARSTREMWQVDGQYLPEREKLHNDRIDAILAKIVEDAKHQDEPMAVFMAGGPGSAKSSAKNLDSPLAPPGRENRDYLKLDNDVFKKLLPEWDEMATDPNDPTSRSAYAAYATHDEAADIMNKLIGRALSLGIHMLIDGTGDDDPGEWEKRLRGFHVSGYKVHIGLFDVPTDIGIGRTLFRAMSADGRYLAPGFTEDTYEKVARAHLGWRNRPWIDSWRLYNTNTLEGEQAVKVGEGGLGAVPKILRNDLYQQFIAKAGGDHGYEVYLAQPDAPQGGTPEPSTPPAPNGKDKPQGDDAQGVRKPLKWSDLARFDEGDEPKTRRKQLTPDQFKPWRPTGAESLPVLPTREPGPADEAHPQVAIRRQLNTTTKAKRGLTAV
jgi:hypothetical protein